MDLLREIAELRDQANQLRICARELELQADEKREQLDLWMKPREEHEQRPPDRGPAPMDRGQQQFEF